MSGMTTSQAIIEAESPKKAFKQALPRWRPTGQKKFRMDNGWDVEENYYERSGWALYANKVNENPADPGGFYWRVGLKQPGADAWFISGTLAHADGTMFWGVPLEEILPRVFRWAERNMQPVQEGESPKDIFKRLPRGPHIADGKAVSGAYLRRLLGRYWAKNVYVWKQPGRFPRGEGILQIDLNNWGLIRDEWASYDLLLDRLKTWRNLQGVPLWINGKPAGKVGKTIVSEAKKPKKPKQPAEPPKPAGPPKGSPKHFFKHHLHQVGIHPRVQEILEYLPEEFNQAFQAGQEAHWENQHVGDYDWWPDYDDELDTDAPDANPWVGKVIYYFDYRTENRKLYGVAMRGDMDGNHDALDEAEVGTPKLDNLEEEYSISAWLKVMRSYWEWVVAHGRDPLGFISIPQREVAKKWIAGFVRDGKRLKLNALRRLGQTPPAPPIPAAEAIASADPEVKKALEYCLVDAQGYTEATEEEALADGAEWDNQNRLILRFEWQDKEAEGHVREHIIRAAQQALDEE